MKQLHILSIVFLTLFYSTFSFAQLTDVVTGLNDPRGLAIHGTNLYVAQFDSEKISKIDLTAATPTTTDVVSTDRPTGIIFNGTDLYISNDSGFLGVTNPMAASPSVTSYYYNDADFIYCYQMAINGNDLYIASPEDNSIKIVDITSISSMETDFVTGLNEPSGLAFYGTDLYISEMGSTGIKISKVDITASSPTPTDVVTGISTGPIALAFLGTDLYIAEFGGSKVSKIDITATSPTRSDVVTGLTRPIGLTFHGTDLYISHEGKISKFIMPTLSVNTKEATNLLTVYPNPTTGSFQVSGLTEKENYQIYNILGSQIKTGTATNKKPIDVSNVPNGIYFLKFENGNTIKLVKE